MGQSEIEVGARVVVRGLKKRDDLIGREGVAVVGTASNGRWEVRLEDDRGAVGKPGAGTR